MSELSINATTLFYECIGSGPPLLLIHGLGSSGEDWAFQREEFSRRHTLILPDLRGSGRSAKPSGPYSIAQFAADLWGCSTRSRSNPADLLGFSLGGPLPRDGADAAGLRAPTAMQCARQLHRPGEMVPKRMRRSRWCARSATAAWRSSSPAGCSRRSGAQTPARRPRARRKRRAYLTTIRALIGWSALDRLHALRASTLVIAAEHDYTPLADKRAEMRHFPQAQLVVIAGSRHGTPFDATDRFNASVLDFLGPPDPTEQTAAATSHQATSAPV
jgi:pimeloyl-ACP methyl ester carboxylesterase